MSSKDKDSTFLPPGLNFPLEADHSSRQRSTNESGTLQKITPTYIAATSKEVAPFSVMSIICSQKLECIEDLQWIPDPQADIQMFMRSWMEAVVKKKLSGSDLREHFLELLPPETLFSQEALNSKKAPIMYKELRDLKFSRNGGVNKRRGLPSKKDLSAYYLDPCATQNACDLLREMIESNIRTLSARRSDDSRNESKDSVSPKQVFKGPEEFHLSTEIESLPIRSGRHRNTPNLDLENTVDVTPSVANLITESSSKITDTPNKQKPYCTESRFLESGRNGDAIHKSNAPELKMTTDPQFISPGTNVSGQNNISTHAVNVLSKLATRFKDRSDKFGGDDGENWEDVYSTYINCVSQWGVPKHAAFRNIENILAGEAKTYYKRKVESNPNAFKTCDEVNQFILHAFHGQEAQEAAMEHLDALSMYELVKEKGSFSASLRAARDEIIKHINLVPKVRQTDTDQKRWIKHAVRSIRWTRPTTARAHEMDFAQMYSTIRAQAIEEDKVFAKKSEARGSIRSKVGDKSLGKAVNHSDLYGEKRENPQHRKYAGKAFGGKCFGCGKVGVKRAECHTCNDKSGYRSDGKKVLQAIHKVSSVEEVSEILTVLQDQFGDNWAELLTGCGDSEETTISSEDTEDEEGGIGNAEEDFYYKECLEAMTCEKTDGYNELTDDLAASFTEQFTAHYVAAEQGPKRHAEKFDSSGASDVSINISDDAHSKIYNVQTEGFTSSTGNDESVEINVALKFSSTTFQGACLDTGACTSVCGRDQAEAYAEFPGFKFKPKPSRKMFRFGGLRVKSQGVIHVRIPVPKSAFIEISADVVEPNVPLLVVLDAFDKHGLYINNVRNLLVNDKLGWGVALERKDGHLYLLWEKEIMFTVEELRKMHKGFYHPSNEKLFKPIKRAQPESPAGETRKKLEKSTEQCKNCQFHSPRPLKFSATIPEQITFNRQVILDLMWIKSKPLLHVVDADTHYSSARFLPGESTKEVWETFLYCWALSYTGFPDAMKADSGSIFTSKEWNKLLSESGIAIEIAPIESSNSMGVNERYHDPLRRIYLKVEHDHPGYPKELILVTANKAMNDTMGPEGLVPSLLVLGSIPHLPAGNNQHPEQQERIAMTQTARMEMEKMVARMRIKRVLKSKAPGAVHALFNEGDPVLVWRKGKKPSDSRWTGSFEAIKIEGKIITVSDKKCNPKEFNATSVKLYTAQSDEGDSRTSRSFT